MLKAKWKKSWGKTWEIYSESTMAQEGDSPVLVFASPVMVLHSAVLFFYTVQFYFFYTVQFYF